MSAEKGADTQPQAEQKSETQAKKLYRIPKTGKVAGVCSGLAEYFEIDVTLIRVIFVVLTLASGGFGLLIYLILAIAMPVDGAIGNNPRGKDIGDNINNLATEMRDSGGVDRIRNFFGIGLIIFGAWLMLVTIFPQWLSLNGKFVWPAILVLLGLFIVTKSRR